MLKYVQSQKSRINLHKEFIGRKANHILEEECRYILAKWEQKTREKTSWQQFVYGLRQPTKQYLMELLCHENQTTIENEFLEHKGVSETFIGWILSSIITTKMLLVDISIQDQQAIQHVSSIKKASIDFHALANYSSFDGMATQKKIEFIYLPMSYPGFMNLTVCLESGLALYYFPQLKKLYLQEQK